MLRAPSTTALLCLEASARLKSFTAAARELHLTQGAVSRQVLGLEQRLGVALFVRRRDALVPTAAGRYYLEEVGPLLRRLDRATANVMAFKGRGGALALSVGASIGTYWLIPRLPDFTRDHGEIVLSLATRVGPVDFGSQQVDASLEFGDGQRHGLHNEFVLPLTGAPYAAPSWIAKHGKTVTARTPHSALIHHSTAPDSWKEWFALEGLPGDPGREGPTFELMAMAFNAAVAGMGVVLLPPYMVGDALAAGRLKRLSRREWRSTRGYYLVYPEVSEELPALKVFREWLRQQAHT